MRNSSKNKTRFFALVLLIVLANCKGNGDHSAHAGDQYTCPMHPQIVREQPGTCPVCGMDLVRKGSPGEEVKITKELSNLLKPTNAAIVSSIKTIRAVKKEMSLTGEAKGVITYDTRRVVTLPIRFGGRIERLYVKYNFQPVRKGQKVLEIYSPELLTAQRELLYLIESDAENSKLIEESKQRLYLLGVSEGQVSQLISSRKESYSFTIFSPVDGYVIQEAALNNLSSAPIKNSRSSGMNAAAGMTSDGNAPDVFNQSQLASTEIQVREGMYVSAGETLFKIINTYQVWVDFDLNQKDAVGIQINDPLEISFDNRGDKTVKAKINFIQPFIKATENFVKLRVYLANPEGEIGQLATAHFNTTSKNSLWIPTTAVLDLGRQKIVFVRRRGVFRPRAVETRNQSTNWIELIDGIDETDSIAYQAQFMVDSESFIRVSKRN